MSRHFEPTTENHDGHEQFRELCALYSSGSLNADEMEQIEGHLRGCRECRDRLQEYSRVVRQMIPLLADERDIKVTSGFDAELSSGRTQLLAKLEYGEREPVVTPIHVDRHRLWYPPLAARYGVSYALVVVLIVCASIAGYFVGKGKIPAAHRPQATQTLPVDPVVPTPQAAREPKDVIKRLTTDINRLEAELSATQKSVRDLDHARTRDAETVSTLIDENAKLKADREQASRNFEGAQAQIAQLNGELHRLRDERDGTVAGNLELNKTVDAFKARLETLTETISEQQKLLAADRDIRELMGARDLLLADVFDIDPNGKNRRPFGRIFYTKNKSLVFYAFDLDKQRGLHTQDVAFQAWGLNDADKLHPLNLGVFYMDNQTNRRWALKFDNPTVLEKINSVFVTVEPSGGSNKPSGKQLLFAYLEAQPNHP